MSRQPAALVSLAEGEYYFSAEDTGSDWAVRIECQDGQPSGGVGVDVEIAGDVVTDNFTLYKCNKSVFNWQLGPSNDSTFVTVDLCAVNGPPQCEIIVNALEFELSEGLSGRTVKAVSEGLYFLVIAVSDARPGTHVSWECQD